MAEGSAKVERASEGSVRTLAIDIGGSGIKAITLDPGGKPLTKRVRVPTPRPATPKAVLRAISKLAKMQPGFDRVSAGFPGVVKDGVVYTAPNLGKGWGNFNLQKALEKKLKRPARVANDAAVQGAGAVSGQGLELVITLGTGFGSALFADGRRIALELGHHPFHKGKTYEQELGARALAKKGRKKWMAYLREAIDDLRRTFNYDRLYIGGGNAKYIRFELPPDVQLVNNIDGLLGGVALWNEPEARSTGAPAPARRHLSRARPVRAHGTRLLPGKPQHAKAEASAESAAQTSASESPADKPLS
jgi:polyphosphate glucokinase